MNFFRAQMQSFTDWLGRVIECIKDFYRPLQDLRIIVISLLAGGFALLYLDQGRDVIRGLVDSANAVISNWPPKGETLREVLPIIWRWVAFMLACAWSGINAWYWANLLYKTGDKGDQQQPRWFLFARRGFGVLPLLAALVAMWLSARTWHLRRMARDAVLCGRSGAPAVVLRLPNHLVHCRKRPEDLQGGRSRQKSGSGRRLVCPHDDRGIVAGLRIASDPALAHRVCLDRRPGGPCLRRYRLHHSDHQLPDLEDPEPEYSDHHARWSGVRAFQPGQRQSPGTRARCGDG